MKLRRVEIQWFRGIRKLDWSVGGDFVCLIGPGDSTKTTILDAIDLALSPRWSVGFDDTDFYQADTSQPLGITVTVSGLPEDLKSDARFGYLARGWGPSGELHDEPEEGDELALSIRLSVDATLEPEWSVVNDRDTDGKPIHAKDRESLGCARLGDFLDYHFAWGRSSVLSRLTSGGDDLAGMLAAAGRAARAEITRLGEEHLADLREAAARAAELGRSLGVAASFGYCPHLDVKAVSIGGGGLSLHDGKVPVRRAGLGTRRILAIAMQRHVARAGGLTLIDEIEHGLEPHRIRRVLQALRRQDETTHAPHVLMTTHAPVVLQELQASELRIVRSHDGETKVLPVPDRLQAVVRKASEAFLARRVLVCEGKTELGLCRRFDQAWAESGPSFGLAGVALADGCGSEASGIALAFAGLRYETAVFADSDVPLQPDEETLRCKGVQVMRWNGQVSTEERIASDLPWEGVADAVRLAFSIVGEQSVRDAIASRLKVNSTDLAEDPACWAEQHSEQPVRLAIGKAAKETGWFKRVARAEELAALVLRYQAAIQNSDLARMIDSIKAWAHDINR